MTGSRSDTRSAGHKPRLGEIATPGRVCPPHNETYDCRIRPNGIGCLRRGGGSGAGRLPDRPDRNRHSGPIRHPNATTFRSAAFGFQSGQAERFGDLHIPAMLPENEREKRGRETKSLRAPYPSGGVPHPRATEPEMRPGRERSVRESGSALRSPGARKARATGFWVARIGLSRQKRRTNPEYLPNPITHFVTPAVLGGVFGPYFPMAGNPLAWSRLENTCTWHIRYINAYDRSAKYFSIPKPG